MKLFDIAQKLDLHQFTHLEVDSVDESTSAYCSDMLSCVMTGAGHHAIWVTLQAHQNIVAVAALLELTAIIISENALPDAVTIEKADQEGIILLGTTAKNFEVCGKLWELGLRSS